MSAHRSSRLSNKDASGQVQTVPPGQPVRWALRQRGAGVRPGRRRCPDRPSPPV